MEKLNDFSETLVSISKQDLKILNCTEVRNEGNFSLHPDKKVLTGRNKCT